MSCRRGACKQIKHFLCLKRRNQKEVFETDFRATNFSYRTNPLSNSTTTFVFKVGSIIVNFILLFYRNMSSKRKSPPSKLQEGAAENANTEAGPATLDFADHPESSDEQHSYYKLSPSCSTRSSISEDEQPNEDERPSKKQRFESLEMTNNLLVPSSFLSLHQINDLQARRRGSSECSSPGAEAKVLGLCNNNNSLLNHNSALSLAHPHKRSMDDVLKRLTSKMNNSTIKEEKRPTPSTTPVKQNK